MCDSNNTDVPVAEGIKSEPPRHPMMEMKRPGKIITRDFVGGLPGETNSSGEEEFAKVVPADGPPSVPRIAIIAVHGMGARQPYDTLDEHTQMLRRNLEITSAACEIATISGCALPRVKMAYTKDRWPREVHVYEAYWAPITKGQVNVKDAIGFLSQTGLNFLAFARMSRSKDRSRFAFNKWWAFPKQPWMTTLFPFMLAVVTLATAFGTLTASKVLHSESSKVAITSYESNLGLAAMSLIPAILSVILLGACFAFTNVASKVRLKKARDQKNLPKVTKNQLDWFFIYATITFFISAPLLLVDNALVKDGPGAHYFAVVTQLLNSEGRLVGEVAVAAILGITFFLSGFTKKYLVDYLGDLIAYSGFTQSTRFHDLHKRVRDTVKTVLQNVYSARVANDPQNNFVYDKIIVSAHSLGTVIAYDALNDLIADDIRATPTQKLNVVERTKLLATCGSPLDKYAYLVRSLQFHDHLYRERACQTTQPLITSYDYRPAEWVNVWTPQDPISSDLGFYDDFTDMAHEPQWVQNYVDTLGSVPFACHRNYFENVVLGREIAKRL